MKIILISGDVKRVVDFTEHLKARDPRLPNDKFLCRIRLSDCPTVERLLFWAIGAEMAGGGRMFGETVSIYRDCIGPAFGQTFDTREFAAKHKIPLVSLGLSELPATPPAPPKRSLWSRFWARFSRR